MVEAAVTSPRLQERICSGEARLMRSALRDEAWYMDICSSFGMLKWNAGLVGIRGQERGILHETGASISLETDWNDMPYNRSWSSHKRPTTRSGVHCRNRRDWRNSV